MNDNPNDPDDYEIYADFIYENWYDMRELDRLGIKPAPVDPRQPDKPNKNHKQCMKCGVTKPIRYYTQPRHRLCMECRADSASPAIDRAAATRAAQPLSPPPPARQPMDAWHRTRDYSVEYARRRRADKDALARASGRPVKTPKYASVKFCVRCQADKPASAFDNPRDRICLACYNPN